MRLRNSRKEAAGSGAMNEVKDTNKKSEISRDRVLLSHQAEPEQEAGKSEGAEMSREMGAVWLCQGVV